MSQLNILIVEDDASYALELASLVKEFGHHVGGVLTSLETAFSIVRVNPPDLILLDIHLKKEGSGLEFGKEIIDTRIPIIYMTEDHNRVLYEKAKSTNLIAYLIKPFNNITLEATINLVHQQREKEFEMFGSFFFIRMGGQYHKLWYRDIIWIQSEGNYCTLNTKGKKFVTKTSLTKLKKQLPNRGFIQIHRSYIVQIKEIDKVHTSKNIININKAELPLGRKYKMDLIKLLKMS